MSTKQHASKSDQVVAMLRRKNGATRRDIIATTGWKVDLGQLAARKGFDLWRDDEGRYYAT